MNDRQAAYRAFAEAEKAATKALDVLMAKAATVVVLAATEGQDGDDMVFHLVSQGLPAIERCRHEMGEVRCDVDSVRMRWSQA